ncbi:MAG: site-2 protease family protein [Candidatus Sumerlaeaceae bacterium]
MRGSIRLGTILGIGVYLHVTFLLLLAVFAWSEWHSSRQISAVIGTVVFILALFGCVLLHEFGHALAARRYGIKTRDITMLPIGGIARLERMPDDPIEELIVAVAGPAVNVVIAFVLFGVLIAIYGLQPILGAVYPLQAMSGNMLLDLAKVNLALVLFNMLPAFPMDGGRVVRALLATRMAYAKATAAAARLGQGMAVLLALDGFGWIDFIGGAGGNPVLVLIAIFVWIGAGQESGAAQLKSTLGGIPVADAMVTDFRTLAPDDPLTRVVDLILAGSQHDFPVAADGGQNVLGIVTRRDLMNALANGGPPKTVREIMRHPGICDATDSLEVVFPRLQDDDCHMLPVMSRGRLVGLLTTENIGEYVMIASALGGRKLERKSA